MIKEAIQSRGTWNREKVHEVGERTSMTLWSAVQSASFSVLEAEEVIHRRLWSHRVSLAQLYSFITFTTALVQRIYWTWNMHNDPKRTKRLARNCDRLASVSGWQSVAELREKLEKKLLIQVNLKEASDPNAKMLHVGLHSDGQSSKM
jgi:hypothetical protein